MIVVGIIIEIILCIASGKIAESKGYNPGLYYLLGFLLPLIGLIIAAAMPNKVSSVDNNNIKTIVNSNNALKKGIIIDSWYLELPFEIVDEEIIVSDDKTKAILSLEMRNIGEKTIKSIYLKIKCFDDTGEIVCKDNEFIYAYQDLSVSTDTLFGKNIFIQLPDSKTREVNIEFEKMSFIDGSVLKREDITNKSKLLEVEAESIYYCEDFDCEYLLSSFSNNKYVPVYMPLFKDDGKWLCICGRTNDGTDHCVRCKRSKKEIKEVLNIEKQEEWYKEIEKQKQENNEHNKKMNKRIFFLAAIVACFIVIAVIAYSIYDANRFSNIAGTYQVCSIVDADDPSEELLDSYLQNYDNDYHMEIKKNGEVKCSLVDSESMLVKNEEDKDLLEEGYQYMIKWSDGDITKRYSDIYTLEEIYIKIDGDEILLYDHLVDYWKRQYGDYNDIEHNKIYSFEKDESL